MTLQMKDNDRPSNWYQICNCNHCNFEEILNFQFSKMSSYSWICPEPFGLDTKSWTPFLSLSENLPQDNHRPYILLFKKVPKLSRYSTQNTWGAVHPIWPCVYILSLAMFMLRPLNGKNKTTCNCYIWSIDIYQVLICTAPAWLTSVTRLL